MTTTLTLTTTPTSEVALREALHEAEDSLTQARADAWRGFDSLAGGDPQDAVDVLLTDLDRRVGPLIWAVTRLGGDPRRCWPGRRWLESHRPPSSHRLVVLSGEGGRPRPRLAEPSPRRPRDAARGQMDRCRN
jgi:hypothetical protein